MTQNIDPIELNNFKQLADEWWDLDGPLKTLHDINPWRLEWINSRFNLTGKHVLDVGCGGGLLCEAMAAAGAVVTGLDLEPDSLNIAKQHAEQNKLSITYIHDSIEDFATQHPQQFGCVTCLEMLEHVPDPAAIIKACAQAVTPNGALFLSTINRNPIAYATTILGAEYLLKLLPQGTHDYNKFIKPSELAKWIRESGLQVNEIRGMNYNPITRKASSTSSLTANYIVFAD